MKLLIVTVGISGSGKSTYRKTLTNYKCVCPDDVRKEITGNISDQSKNNEVWIIAYERLRTYLECDKEVIFDSTACSSQTVQKIMSVAKKFNYEVVFKLFETDEQTAFERIQHDLKNKIERSNVPIGIIKHQLHNYELVKNYLYEQNYKVDLMSSVNGV